MLPYLRRMESDAELRRPALPRRRRADPGPAPGRARRGGPPTTRSPRRARARATRGARTTTRPRAPASRRTASARATARASRPTTATSSRRASARTCASSAAPRSTGCSSRRGRAVGVRARVGERLDRGPRRQGRPVRRRDPLPGDPAALGHRARGPGRRGCPVGEGMQEHPLALFWLFPAPGRAARPRRAAGQLLPALLVRARGRGRQRHDDRVGQPDARPAGPTSRSHLVMDAPGGTWGGAGGGQAAGRPRPAVPVGNQQFGRGVAGAWRRPTPTSHPLIEQDLLDVARRPACACATASSAALELLRSGAFDTAFEHIAHRHDRPRPRRRCPTTRRSTRG